MMKCNSNFLSQTETREKIEHMLLSIMSLAVDKPFLALPSVIFCK